MISYELSQKILVDVAKKYCHGSNETISLENSIGKILAEDIYAKEANPPFDNSAMDGFALNLSLLDLEEKTGKKWIRVSGLIAAGTKNVRFSEFLNPQTKAVEIMTGAELPAAEFDTVIRIENVQVRADLTGQKEILLKATLRVGDNLRRVGEDTRQGDILLTAGSLIQENHLLVLATQGITELKVNGSLSVAIISTGEEIVDFHQQVLQPGQIRNSTGIYLEKVLSSVRTNVTNFGIVSDSSETYKRRLLEIFNHDIDIVVSTGAVSMGVFDFVKTALVELGANIHFHKCAIRPGKPILFASLKHNNKIRFIFGVPGNPVSTAVGYNFFIRTFLDAIFGITSKRSQTMTLSEGVKKPEGLRCFFKAKTSVDENEQTVQSLKRQASFMVSPMLLSDAWVILPEQGDYVEKGKRVEVLRT